jgi:hypothetical protein
MRPSPLQNRCAPDGSLHAVAARGTLFGNRGGRIHRADFSLGSRRWASRAWICCLTEFRGRHRQVMGEGYTEIFFLDEATALAAGHRPCFECRRAAARAFAAAWPGSPPPRAPDMDRVLHNERRAPPEPVTYAALPAGAIFAADGAFYLKSEGSARAWNFAGYTPARAFDTREIVAAVTPPSIRATLAAGYRPQLHPSARA